MFRKNRTVVYPIYGTGKIVDVFKNKIDDKKVKYYRVEFYDSTVTISIPVKKAKELGLRFPVSEYKLKKVLNEINKRVRVTPRLLKTVDAMAKELMSSGKIEDAVEVFNTLKAVGKKKKEEGRSLSQSSSATLESAQNFIKSEIAIVMGKRSVDKYEEALDY